MGDGKRKLLDCGHVGEAVISQFYLCPVCDVSDGVPEHVPPEETKKLCPHCGDDDLEVFPGFSILGKDLWFCNHCMRSHHRP